MHLQFREAHDLKIILFCAFDVTNVTTTVRFVNMLF